MIKFICDICNKEFVRKAHLDSHKLKKKNPCNKLFNNTQNHTNNTQNHTNNTQNHTNNTQNQINDIENNIKQIKSNNCIYCGLILSRKDALTRHIKTFCKVKKIQDQEKDKIFNILLKKENEEQKQIIKEQKKIIKEQNDKINKILEKVSIKNINKGVINNITISPNKLVKFGTEDVSKIDTKVFANVLNKSGKDCFLEIADKIYNNDKYPQYKTIYMNDKNRNQFMTYDGKNWKLNNIKVLYIVVEKLKKFIDIKNDEIEEKIKNNPVLQDKIKTRLMKYYNMYFDETDDATPERKKEFQNMLDKSLIEFLYNIKDSVKNNYNYLLEEAQKIDSSNLIDI
jgi:hypothetical protein